MVNPTTTTAAVGQLDPYVAQSEWAKIAFVCRNMIARIDTMKLVQVVAVHGGGGAVAAAGTVDVQILVSAIDPAGNSVPAGIVYGIPWWRLQGGIGAVICDPVKGDIGYVLCADRDISNVKTAAANGKSPQVTPGSFRRYSVADGIYVGGCLTKDAPAQYLRFTPDSIEIVDKSGNVLRFTTDGIQITDKNGNVVQTSASGIALTPKSGQPVTITGNLVVKGNLGLQGQFVSDAGSTYAGAISTTGNVIAGAGTGDQVGLQTHGHPANNTPPNPGS